VLKRVSKAVPVFAVAALLGWTACNTHRVHADSEKNASGRKLAPEFSLKDEDGRTVRLSDYRGKVVVLDFWATWCSPCRTEIPWFTEFERRNKDRGFAVLGVSMDDDGWPVVKPFLKDLKVNYRVLLGDDHTADMYGGIDALPTTFIIDRDGRIAATHVGLAGKEEFEDAIENLLASGGSSAAPARSTSTSAVAAPHGL
jgi:cytochrome c biogenesis protein CcmG/thiol:disulfide interchange protein DsbE